MTTAVASSNNNDIFRQLEVYNWDKDKEFQGGLIAILGPNPSPSQTTELTLRAQCFYFSRKKGISIDFDAYKAYLSSKQSHNSSKSTAYEKSTDQPTEEHKTSLTPILSSSSSSSSALPQNTILTNSQDIKTSTALPSSTPNPATSKTDKMANPSSTPSNPEQAPYPASFAQIVAMITSGQPIPGIVDIPNIVKHGQGTKPSIPARRKPWEMHKTEEEVQWGREGTFGDRRDEFVVQEFPEEEEREDGNVGKDDTLGGA